MFMSIASPPIYGLTWSVGLKLVFKILGIIVLFFKNIFQLNVYEPPHPFLGSPGQLDGLLTVGEQVQVKVKVGAGSQW